MGDFHSQVMSLGKMMFPNFSILVLSMDTAVDTIDGNILQGPAVAAIVELLCAPIIAAMVSEPPCETWSTARHVTIEMPDGRCTPRPLRNKLSP